MLLPPHRLQCLHYATLFSLPQENPLFHAKLAARRGKGDRTAFELLVVPRGGEVPQLTELVLHVGPGDQGEPVVTLMLLGEE